MNLIGLKIILHFVCIILIAWFWGDPHFTTLDNYTYTFNGIGEYVLLRSAGEVNVEFQGRTAVAPNSNATVFSAFAIQHEGTTVQVNHTVSPIYSVCAIHQYYILPVIMLNFGMTILFFTCQIYCDSFILIISYQ